MLFNIIFKQYLNIFIRNFVLCIQIRFVSTEKTTRIASRASCYIIYVAVSHLLVELRCLITTRFIRKRKEKTLDKAHEPNGTKV